MSLQYKLFGKKGPTEVNRTSKDTVNKVKSEFYRIKNLGPVKDLRPNNKDGGIGNTFEDHLGVDENNLKDPDFLDFEVKTQRQLTKSASSLFSLKPTFPKRGDTYMRNNWGIKDTTGLTDHNVFRTSVYAHRWTKVYSKYLMSLVVDEENEKLKLLLCDLNENVLDDCVFWSFDDLRNASSKLKNTIAVKAKRSIINNEVHYHYTNAKILVGFKFENFIDLIIKGLVRYDNRLGVYRSGPNIGKEHNHGGGLRLTSSKHFPLLFESYEEL